MLPFFSLILFVPKQIENSLLLVSTQSHSMWFTNDPSSTAVFCSAFFLAFNIILFCFASFSGKYICNRLWLCISLILNDLSVLSYPGFAGGEPHCGPLPLCSLFGSLSWGLLIFLLYTVELVHGFFCALLVTKTPSLVVRPLPSHFARFGYATKGEQLSPRHMCQ